MSRAANFDRISRPYRWLEYLTLGRALERCRSHFLSRLACRSNALVLGDGDGRFLFHLLATNPSLTVDAVDLSAAMLKQLEDRCAFASSRLATHHADALAFIEARRRSQPKYDLIVTHFFLDCLTQSQMDTLAASVARQLAPNALWLLSDFHIPTGPMRFPARVLIRGLYLAFRILTGLRTTRLPDHAPALTAACFTLIDHHDSLFGMLTTELWSNSCPADQLSPLE